MAQKRDKNKQDLPQVPSAMKSNGQDVEYSEELADRDDLEAKARAEAANRRVASKKQGG